MAFGDELSVTQCDTSGFYVIFQKMIEVSILTKVMDFAD